MIKHFKSALLLVATIFMASLCASAQQMPSIPVDDAVRIGKLPNGLTYYIRHNETPKGQADFYIAQKVGSVLEEDNQRGLAHFLEHMCFNGTENFPGNSLISWLESVGVKFGQNLNASTGVEQTIYNIANVPVARTGVQDSCLLILHDWANALTLDPEEIDKERGVIHQEWRTTNVGVMRVLEEILPNLYPEGSRYGVRLPIGTMEVVDNFPPQALRDYYETWYRPDQQGVIVVGDIDVDYIEGKIKELFSDIEMPENAKERVYEPVPDNAGTLYAIGSDPEVQEASVELMFKTDAFPEDQKTSMIYLIQDYAIDMVSTMLQHRLSDLALQPDAPFADAGFSYGNYLVSKTKECFDLNVTAKGDDVLPALEAAYREVLRAVRGGFTVSEYERARSEYMSRIERLYNGRDKMQNGYYVRQYINNFTDNEPIPSLADMYMAVQQLAPMIPVEVINSVLPEIISNDNRSLLAIVPSVGGFKVPTEEELAAVIASVDAEEIEPYKDEMKEEPLIPSLPVPGKVVSVVDNEKWDAKTVTLSNGVKVVVKNTTHKPDEIIFTAVALGGTSTIPDTEANELIFMGDAMGSHGLGDYTSLDLKKYLMGKQASCVLQIGNYNRALAGSSTVKDLPTLMELIYMSFIDYNITADEYAATQNTLNATLRNQESDPMFAFQQLLMNTLFESAANQTETPEIVSAAKREGILDIIHGCMANAADYTFYFVGDVTVEQITPLLEQYIATLPAIAEKATTNYTVNKAREIKGGTETTIKTTKMETPQTWCAIVITGNMPYTSENQKVASIIGQILSNRLLAKIREEMGAVYSIQAVAGMQPIGSVNTVLQIPFPMKPEMRDEVLAEIDKMLQGMCTDITDDELNPIKEYMVKSYNEGLERNASWLNAMTNEQLNGVDTFHNTDKVIEGITVKDVEKFMQQLLSQGNHRVMILDPEQ